MIRFEFKCTLAHNFYFGPPNGRFRDFSYIDKKWLLGTKLEKKKKTLELLNYSPKPQFRILRTQTHIIFICLSVSVYLCLCLSVCWCLSVSPSTCLSPSLPFSLSPYLALRAFSVSPPPLSLSLQGTDRFTIPHDITDIILKTAINTIQSIIISLV